MTDQLVANLAPHAMHIAGQLTIVTGQLRAAATRLADEELDAALTSLRVEVENPLNDWAAQLHALIGQT